MPLSKRSEPATTTVPSYRPLERRQLTIMFTDLVNSTALSDQLDPEDFRTLIEAHRTAAVAPIKRYGGVVARYLGDGMLVYFGYPEAHEDDPDRAVRAGLAIVEATKAMNERWVGEGHGKIAVRIGIHTGIVVVGDVVKQDVQETMAVFGNPPSMAARLQAIAAPNSVVLSGATKSLLRPGLRCVPRGKTLLKGIAKPVEVFTAGEVDGRMAADAGTAQARKILPFVNRERELSALRLGWTSAAKGEGKAFLLTGDPGIGKSRLIRMVEEWVVEKSCHWLMARTSPYATNSDFFAFSEFFQSLFQPDDDIDAGTTRYQQLQGLLGDQEGDDANDMFGFANLLGIEIPAEAAPHSLQPERLRELTLGAITGWFERQSTNQPLALVIEDLHWADASTLETIKLLLAKLASMRILLIMSSRETDVLGEAASYAETLKIERLQPDYAKALIDHVVLDAGLSDVSVQTLLERAAGVPLFIEELPKPVLEDGRAAGLGQGGDPITLPATLRDSLMAQLDRMGVGKIVAQTGAVLGHSFDETLMRRVWSGGLQQMEEGLNALTEAGLLTRHGTSPEATYAFKHALLAEIAYDSLLRQECRQIHRRTADALVAHFPALADTRPELIARHYAAAWDASVAFDYWMKAGKAAARRSANTEAIGHLRSAEAELEQLKTKRGKDLNKHLLSLYLTRGPVLIALSGWATSDVEQNYRHAWEIAQTLDAEPQKKFAALGGLYNVYLLRGDVEMAREVNDREHRMAAEIGYDEVLPKWHSGAGYCDFLTARFENARQHMTEVTRLYNSNLESRHTVSYGIHPFVIANSARAMSEWFLGCADEADASIQTAIESARQARHPFSICYALCFSASISQCKNNTSQALEAATEAFELAEEQAFSYWIGWSRVIMGWAQVRLGKSEEGLVALQDGLIRYRATGAAQMLGYMLCLLAEAYAIAGRHQDAVVTCREAILTMEQTGIVFYRSEAYRLLGQSLCSLDGSRTDGVRMLMRSFRIAESQNSPPMLLRVTKTSLPLIEQSRPRLKVMIEKRMAQAMQGSPRSSKCNWEQAANA
ncbi:MAG: ATP-binding protein [Geminicoccales bacterium]